MNEDLKKNADLLKTLLAMGAVGATGDDQKMTVGKAIEDITTAVAKTGGDAAKIAAVAKEKAPLIEAVLKAIGEGKDADAEITFKVAKSDDTAAGAATEALTKAAEILKGLQGTVAKEDVICAKCGWKGTTDFLKDGACPECGAKIAAAPEKKGFEKAKADLQADMEKAKAKEPTDEEKAALKDRLAQLQGTDKGKDDADLKKASTDLEEITKGVADADDDGDWPIDLAVDDDKK